MVNENEDSKPSADRERSYDGGYMKVGRIGENIAFDVLRNHPAVEVLEDLRDDLDYQARGIDARLKLRDSGRLVTVEIKTDNHLDVSERWLFELYRIYLTVPVEMALVAGWSVRSESEWLICYAPTTRHLHFVKMEDYRRAHLAASKDGMCRYSLVATDRIKRTLNAYFPEGYVHKMESYRVFSIPTLPMET